MNEEHVTQFVDWLINPNVTAAELRSEVLKLTPSELSEVTTRYDAYLAEKETPE